MNISVGSTSEATGRLVSAGNAMRLRRKALGVTQEELAAILGKDQNYVSFVETGRIKRPARWVVVAIARALDVPPGELLTAWDYAPNDIEEVPDLAHETVPVRDWGWVPADQLRWMESTTRGQTLDVPLGHAKGRSPGDLFVLHASGDCLMRRGISDGTIVVCEVANDRQPRNGQIVAVRVGEERSLKVWQREGDHIRLCDGDGNVVAALTTTDDMQVVGYVLTSWTDHDGE